MPKDHNFNIQFSVFVYKLYIYKLYIYIVYTLFYIITEEEEYYANVALYIYIDREYSTS